jgi:hypothetical protein
MNREDKLKLLERLVKEGNITLSEAFDLMEPEHNIEPIIQPFRPMQPYTSPYTNPTPPFYPNVWYTSNITQ